jgi:hypothetical protein
MFFLKCEYNFYKNSRIKSTPFSREDLGGLLCHVKINLQMSIICKWFLIC